jgi:hypothetical protein
VTLERPACELAYLRSRRTAIQPQSPREVVWYILENTIVEGCLPSMKEFNSDQFTERAFDR